MFRRRILHPTCRAVDRAWIKITNDYPTVKIAGFGSKDFLPKFKEKIQKSSPMVIMLVLAGLLFGGIISYLLVRGYLIQRYMTSMAEPPVTVSTVCAKYQPWQPRLKASGSLRAVQGVDVTTEIAGMVRSIEFAPGSLVNAGDILVKLNADTEIAQLHSLQALAELAKINYERDKAQYAINAVSKAVVDSDEADLKAKIAQVEEQAATVAKKTIIAPFTGRLGIRVINLGQYLNAGNKIVTLQSLDPIYVDFYVPQQLLSQLAIGQTVTITSNAFSESFSGKITTIDPKVDSSTRNAQVEATISNPNYKLLPGMYVDTEVNIAEAEQHLTLPQTAISYNPYGELIYIVKETGKDKKGQPILTVKQTFVTVGEKRGDQVAVLKGLKEGDTVVSSGQHKLKNGSVIVINNKVQPLDNAHPIVKDE
jgi:membrane fusion protein (multidrug efflux system)